MLSVMSALIKLQQLVRPPLSKSVQFIFRKSDPSTFREVLKDVRTRGIYSIIIDTRPESLPHLLTAVSVLTFYLIRQKYWSVGQTDNQYISRPYFGTKWQQICLQNEYSMIRPFVLIEGRINLLNSIDCKMTSFIKQPISINSNLPW